MRMSRREFKRVIAKLAARAFHREISSQHACHVRIAYLSHGRHIVQVDRNGDPYPALDLRRCWRANGIYRTPTICDFTN